MGLRNFFASLRGPARHGDFAATHEWPSPEHPTRLHLLETMLATIDAHHARETVYIQLRTRPPVHETPAELEAFVHILNLLTLDPPLIDRLRAAGHNDLAARVERTDTGLYAFDDATPAEMAALIDATLTHALGVDPRTPITARYQFA